MNSDSHAPLGLKVAAFAGLLFMLRRARFISQSRTHAIPHREKRQIARRAPRPARGPGGIAPRNTGEGIGGGKRTQGAVGKPGTPSQILHAHEGRAIARGTGGEQRFRIARGQPSHQPQAKP